MSPLPGVVQCPLLYPKFLRWVRGSPHRHRPAKRSRRRRLYQSLEDFNLPDDARDRAGARRGTRPNRSAAFAGTGSAKPPVGKVVEGGCRRQDPMGTKKKKASGPARAKLARKRPFQNREASSQLRPCVKRFRSESLAVKGRRHRCMTDRSSASSRHRLLAAVLSHCARSVLLEPGKDDAVDLRARSPRYDRVAHARLRVSVDTKNKTKRASQMAPSHGWKPGTHRGLCGPVVRSLQDEEQGGRGISRVTRAK